VTSFCSVQGALLRALVIWVRRKRAFACLALKDLRVQSPQGCRRMNLTAVWAGPARRWQDLRGRPIRLPFARAAAIPERTRSRISSRSNSAMVAKMPKIRRPFAVDVSTPSCTLTKSMPQTAKLLESVYQLAQ
jgi:hypothetical protein